MTLPSSDWCEPSGSNVAGSPALTVPNCVTPMLAVASNPPPPCTTTLAVDEAAVTELPTVRPSDTTVPAIGLVIVACAIA